MGSWWRLPGLFMCCMGAYECAAQPSVYYHGGTTRKVSQLTGDLDRPYGIPTASMTETLAGLAATDLGSTFEHEGKLVFLFGDTWGGRVGDFDTIGFSISADPWQLEMEVPTGLDGLWRRMMPPGLGYGAFCVPSHGISVDGTMYVVYTQDGAGGELMKRSFLISSDDDGATWQTLFQLSNNTEASPRFVNVWLEERDGYVYIFGSGAYRASSPMLARVPRAQIGQKSAWMYFSGMLGGSPVWSPYVTSAKTLFTHNQVGEFSCAWVETLGCWVMLYNCGSPRGIIMRTASEPWGPWSAGQQILNPWLNIDQAYGYYMHSSWEVEPRDLFSDPFREYEWGGEYGPYLISRFTSGSAQRAELYFTMSTWNPYQVVLMRSIVGTAPAPAEAPTVSQTLNHGGWSRYPSDVAADFEHGGRPHITTYNDAGDAGTGWLWQQLPAGTKQVNFRIHGGHAEVFLLEGGADLPAGGSVDTVSQNLRDGVYGRVALRATGVDDNTNDISWNWDVRKFDHPLKVVVIDDLDENWGFVSLSDLQIEVALMTQVNNWMLYD